MKEKPKLEFEVDFDTQKPQMYPMGRLCVGLSDGMIRVFLMPDGLHYMIPKTGMGRFLHIYDDQEDMVFAGGTKE